MRDDRPNILLLMTDQQRFDTIASLGGAFGARTPAMDNLVRNGVTFDRAFCTTPICSASRGAIMTGLMPTRNGVYANLGNPCSPLGPAQITIGHRMQAAGYETVYHGKWHLGGTPASYGFETVVHDGYDDTVALEACRFWRNRDWLENRRPFFQVVSFLNPHDVYFFDPEAPLPENEPPLAPPSIVPTLGDTLESKPFPQQFHKANWSADTWQRCWRWYAQCVEKVDRLIGQIVNELICSGYGPNTWIIFTADHANSAGEHGLPFKGPWMYDGVMRVPLVVVPPQLRFCGKGRGAAQPYEPFKPRRSSRLTSLIDLVPTFMDLAQIAPDPSLPGKSLMPAVRGEDEVGHEAIYGEWYQSGKFVSPIRMIRTTTHKYTRYLGYGEELYDLERDPLEMTNLATDSAHASILSAMRGRLAQYLESSGDPFLTYQPTDPTGKRLN